MVIPLTRITLALLAGMLVVPLTRAQSAPPPTPGGAPSPWNTRTAPAPAPAPAEDSTLSLRLYEGLASGDKLPYRRDTRRRDDPAWAVDVSAVMTRCPDGNLVITALVIGGNLTPLDSRCPGEPKPTRPNAPGATPQCDADTWNCANRPAE